MTDFWLSDLTSLLDYFFKSIHLEAESFISIIPTMFIIIIINVYSKFYITISLSMERNKRLQFSL